MSDTTKPQPGDPRPVDLTTQPAVAGNRTGGQTGSESIGVPAVLLLGFGYQMVDGSHAARLRFELPPQMMWVRRVRLNFSLLPAVYVAQSGTVSGGTTGAGTTHDHDITVAGSQVTVIDGNATPQGGGIEATFRENGANVTRTISHGVDVGKQVPGQGDKWQTYDEAAHTHSIAGGSITLGAPSALGTSGIAQGSHVTIDGIDYTSTLGGPFGVGANPTDISDLDLSALQKPGTKESIWTRGIHEIDLSSSQLGGISAQLVLIATINAS